MSHKLDEESATVSLDIRVPTSLKSKIQRAAKKSGVKMSEYIRVTMQEKLKQVDTL